MRTLVQRSKRRRKWPWIVGVVVLLAGGAAVAVPALLSEKWPYRAQFGQSWAVGTSQGGEARVDGEEYVLIAKPGWRLWKSAPRNEPADGVTITAEASVEEGSGEYGVWCHGSASAGDRYEFSVTAAGAATIVKRRAGGQATVLYGPSRMKDTADTRITARCAQDDGKTVLALWVNGKEAGQVTDADAPYTGNTAGVHAAPAGEQAMRVRFTAFALEPARP